ncbi:phytoene desaturase family protein [Streptomyces sp. CA-111067]|uniref:phytoene desaturase family protein n=1 Tax=Streptomyces sp. CA-111067 TaxID=3240046 RepID=UPI003D9768F0
MARIAVIGAGMAALAAAARLATGGHRVVVHERAAGYGGGVGRLARDGFGFDTGPGLLLLPAVYRDLFVKTGRETLEHSVSLTQTDPASRHVFADGTAVALPNASRSGVIEALDGALGAGSGERWSEVMVRAREVWEATRRPLLEDALSDDTGPLGRDPYPLPARRGLLRRTAPPATLAGVAQRELRDPRLAALLESYPLGYGFDPRTVPAAAAVLPYVEQTFGVWYVAGGIRALADAVYERCLARKVEFRFGAEVTGVLDKDGRAAGVELADGSVFEADFVVAGAPLPPAVPSPDASSAAPPPGRFTVHLALRGPRPANTVHRTVVHAADRTADLAWTFQDGPAANGAPGGGRRTGRTANGGSRTGQSAISGSPAARSADSGRSTGRPANDRARGGRSAAEPGTGLGPANGGSRSGRSADGAAPATGLGPAVGGPTVTVLRPDDPALRPDDAHEAVTLQAVVPPHAAGGGAGAVDWEAAGVAGGFADRVVAAALAAVPDLAERELWREVRTPADTERETGAPGGSVPGPALAGAAGALLRPANRAPLRGLYLVGGWAHPGGGLPHAGMSGAIVADLIAGGPGGSR